ncbi:hypothetical protein C8N32_10672 [Rhodovulum imhoffii]|uniref:Uncharacterized protein n=1 Tax=Rhodovulum imhoffii TaxID=365340 RepID=A0A2T5BT58_9RHOB|nr:hypothetical protein [Rhodovulum imhoffii]MBK5932685.1 hypothetical protein [Rhodovulum imhoffii]PTN02499.1 hypothetical protein C8N32_10672 [Rhodovulum imhoffii]
MTALHKFQRLESPGLWRDTPQAQRRDVIVSFGENSLVISDFNEIALTHWSLAAVSRLNPGRMPALYSPGEDATETLEIDDATMVGAIEKIRAALGRGRPRSGRLRQGTAAAAALLVLGLAVFWLPGALVRHAVGVVPPEIRAEIGQDLLRRVTVLHGPPCVSTGSSRALTDLSARLLPGKNTRLVVLPSGGVSAHLPGGMILLNRALIEEHEDASALAAHTLAEDLRITRQDPLSRVLRHAGVLATFRFLTTGALPESALDAYARDIFTAPAQLPANQLLDRFAVAGVSPGPYARSLGRKGAALLSQAAPPANAPVPLMPDGEWVRLQAMCN